MCRIIITDMRIIFENKRLFRNSTRQKNAARVFYHILKFIDRKATTESSYIVAAAPHYSLYGGGGGGDARKYLPTSRVTFTIWPKRYMSQGIHWMHTMHLRIDFWHSMGYYAFQFLYWQRRLHDNINIIMATDPGEITGYDSNLSLISNPDFIQNICWLNVSPLL